MYMCSHQFLFFGRRPSYSGDNKILKNKFRKFWTVLRKGTEYNYMKEKKTNIIVNCLKFVDELSFFKLSGSFFEWKKLILYINLNADILTRAFFLNVLLFIVLSKVPAYRLLLPFFGMKLSPVSTVYWLVVIPPPQSWRSATVQKNF